MTDKTQKIIETFLREPKFSKRDEKGSFANALRELINQFAYNHFHLDGDHGIDVVNVRDIMSLIRELENYKSNKIYYSDYGLDRIKKVRILEYIGDMICKVEVMGEGRILNQKYFHLYETEDDLMNDRHIIYADVLEELYDG